MSHSKRNTTLPYSTAHERSLLQATWGTQKAQLSRESFLALSACRLCLFPATDPVSCAHGDIFCRHCAIQNILDQMQEIQLQERVRDRRKIDDEVRNNEQDKVLLEEGVRQFELVQVGLEKRHQDGSVSAAVGMPPVPTMDDNILGSRQLSSVKLPKRKFELDESQVLAILEADKARLAEQLRQKNEVDANTRRLPSFWVPSQTPPGQQTTNSGGGNTTVDIQDSKHRHNTTKATKLVPTCPAANPDDLHPISRAHLINVCFTMSDNDNAESKARSDSQASTALGDSTLTPICPSCSKALTNVTRAVLAIPCGHVLCKPCADNFVRPQNGKGRSNMSSSWNESGAVDAKPEDGFQMRCYVCDESLCEKADDGNEGNEEHRVKKQKKNLKKNKGPRPGLVEIRSEGTGFLGRGKNMVEKKGTAFKV